MGQASLSLPPPVEDALGLLERGCQLGSRAQCALRHSRSEHRGVLGRVGDTEQAGAERARKPGGRQVSETEEWQVEAAAERERERGHAHSCIHLMHAFASSLISIGSLYRSLSARVGKDSRAPRSKRRQSARQGDWVSDCRRCKCRRGSSGSVHWARCDVCKVQVGWGCGK